MKNSLQDLNNYLFAALENLDNPDLDAEQLEHEIKRADAVCGIADKIIESGKLMVKSAEVMAEYGLTSKEAGLQALLPMQEAQ